MTHGAKKILKIESIPNNKILFARVKSVCNIDKFFVGFLRNLKKVVTKENIYSPRHTGK